ncbi:MAG: 2-hydroxyacid dehydrogenase [Pseudomonadota bacterium]
MDTILLIDCHDDDRERVLRETLNGEWHIANCALDDPTIGQWLADTVVAITSGWRQVMPPAPQLRLLQVPGAGYDGVHFSGVPSAAAICNTFEHEIGMSEYIVLGMLEWQIRLAKMDQRMRRHEWKDGFVVAAPLHGELYGKKVGFIGYGHIAAATAERLRPFGATLSACTRSPDKYANLEHVRVSGMSAMDQMFTESDYIVVTCPLSDETRGLVKAEHLAKMSSTAVLLNVARGPIVEEKALFDACAENRIGGAIIDTWYHYPDPSGDLEQRCQPSDYPFHTLDNVIMSSHASGWTERLFDRRMSEIGRNINRMMDGEALTNVLRPGTP